MADAIVMWLNGGFYGAAIVVFAAVQDVLHSPTFAKRGSPMVLVCSECHRIIKTKESNESEVFGHNSNKSSGICLGCLEKMVKDLASYMQSLHCMKVKES